MTMKPGPFRRLLDRAQAAGVDTTGYSPENADRLERRVNEAEVRQASQATVAAVRAQRPAGNTVTRLCQGLGLDPDNIDHRSHVIAYMDSVVVMVEREAKYKGLWKQSGADDNTQNLYSKAQRVKRGIADSYTFDQAAAYEDDLKDIINYAIFTLVNIRAGRIGEEHPDNLDRPVISATCGLCGVVKSNPTDQCDNCGKYDRRPQE